MDPLRCWLATSAVNRTKFTWRMSVIFPSHTLSTGRVSLVSCSNGSRTAEVLRLASSRPAMVTVQTTVVILGMTFAAIPAALTFDRITNGLTRPFFGWLSDHHITRVEVQPDRLVIHLADPPSTPLAQDTRKAAARDPLARGDPPRTRAPDTFRDTSAIGGSDCPWPPLAR